MPVFTTVIRVQFDPVVEADRCAQYVDDIRVAAYTASELIENLERAYKQTHKAGLNLCIENCLFGIHSTEFLRKTLPTSCIAPIEERITESREKLKLPSGFKTLQCFLGFVNFYKQYIPSFADKSVPLLHLLLRKDVPFKVSQQLKD